ncbi:MAG: hypothetical protein V2A56_03400 [bacterium]
MSSYSSKWMEVRLIDEENGGEIDRGRRTNLSGDTAPQRPWILLERARFGDANCWNEYYMHDWERTQEYILQQQMNRKALGPDGKPIRKP